MLNGELQVVEPATFESLEKDELLSDVDESLWELVESLFVRHGQARQVRSLALHEAGDALFNNRVGNQANKHPQGNGQNAKNDRSRPLRSGLVGVRHRDAEWDTTNKNDEDLRSAHCHIDADKKPVSCQAFQNVELVIEPAVATEC